MCVIEVAGQVMCPRNEPSVTVWLHHAPYSVVQPLLMALSLLDQHQLQGANMGHSVVQSCHLQNGEPHLPSPQKYREVVPTITMSPL